jgi:hypothetical protein
VRLDYVEGVTFVAWDRRGSERQRVFSLQTTIDTALETKSKVWYAYADAAESRVGDYMVGQNKKIFSAWKPDHCLSFEYEGFGSQDIGSHINAWRGWRSSERRIEVDIIGAGNQKQ